MWPLPDTFCFLQLHAIIPIYVDSDWRKVFITKFPLRRGVAHGLRARHHELSSQVSPSLMSSCVFVGPPAAIHCAAPRPSLLA